MFFPFFKETGKTLQATACTPACAHAHTHTHTHTQTPVRNGSPALTGISTYNPPHWGLYNPHTRPWPEIQKLYAKSVGGKANSLLPAEGYTDNYYTALG